MRLKMPLAYSCVLLTLLTSSVAQYFPAAPKNVTVVKSQLEDGVSISFKEVYQCATVSESRLTVATSAWYL